MLRCSSIGFCLFATHPYLSPGWMCLAFSPPGEGPLRGYTGETQATAPRNCGKDEPLTRKTKTPSFFLLPPSEPQKYLPILGGQK